MLITVVGIFMRISTLKDVRTMFEKSGGAYDIVGGRGGGDRARF